MSKANRAKTNGTIRAAPATREHSAFDALIAKARKTPPEDLISADELDRRNPLTAEEVAQADAWLDEMEREGGVSIGPVTSAPSSDGAQATYKSST